MVTPVTGTDNVQKVPNMSRDNWRAETDLAEIPPEIEERLSEWEDALALIDQTGRVDFFELNAKRWNLGRRMVSTLDALGEEGTTRVLQAVARRLGKSRTYLYHMMWVARAWPEHLPRRPWTVLRKLSRLPKAQRDELEEHLPLDCSAKAIPSPKKEPNLTPVAKVNREQAARETALTKAAEQAYLALPEEARPAFLLALLRKLDLSTLSDSSYRRYLAEELPKAATAASETAASLGDSPAAEEDDGVFDL